MTTRRLSPILSTALLVTAMQASGQSAPVPPVPAIGNDIGQASSPPVWPDASGRNTLNAAHSSVPALLLAANDPAPQPATAAAPDMNTPAQEPPAATTADPAQPPAAVEDKAPPHVWLVPAAGEQMFTSGLGESLDPATTAASLTPMSDGGFVLAGSVPDATETGVWVARYDTNSHLLWTHSFATPFGMLSQGAAPLPDDGTLIVGNLPEEDAAFLMALNPDGNVRWSRVAHPQDQEGETPKAQLHAIASAADGSSLAIGQHTDYAAKPAGFALALSAEGATQWEATLPAGVQPHAVHAQKDGWLIAGESAEPAGAAWLGHITTKGKLDWQKSYGDAQSGAASALALLPDGSILLAGQGAKGAGLWWQSVNAGGKPGKRESLTLKVDQTDLEARLQALTSDPAGGFWLSGSTADNQAWIARLDDEGNALWTRLYGNGKPGDLDALLPRPQGALAAGQIDDGEQSGEALWLVPLDPRGEVAAPRSLSDRGRKVAEEFLRDWFPPDSPIQFGSTPQVSEGRDGHLRLTLPFARTETEAEDASSIELGELQLDLQPLPKPDLWHVVMTWPSRLFVRDEYGNMVGTIEDQERHFELDWRTDTRAAASMDVGIKGFLMHIDGNPCLAGIYDGLGIDQGDALMSGSEEARNIHVAMVQATLTPNYQPNGLQDSLLHIRMQGLKALDGNDAPLMQLDEVMIDAQSQDFDEAAFMPPYNRITTAMMEEDPESLLPQSRQMVEQMLRASGRGKGEFSLRNLTIGEPDSEQYLHVDKASISSQGTPSDDDKLHWDLSTRYSIQGLTVRTDGEDVSMGDLGFGVDLHHLALADLIDLILQVGITQSPPDPVQLLGLSNRLLKTFDLDVHLGKLRLESDGPDTVTELKSHLKLSELDTETPSISLQYDHQGMSNLPDVPQELTPGTAKLDLQLSRIPVMELVGNSMNPDAGPEQAISALASAGTRLDIKELHVEAPLTGVQGHGEAQAQAPETDDAPPVLQASADVDVRDLEALAQWAEQNMDEEDRGQLLGVVALLQLAGDKKKRDDGAVIYHFTVQWSSEGTFKINGKDPSSLMGAAQ